MKANLNKPSGSNGARHQLGASSRIGPSPGELNVHSYKSNIRNIIRRKTAGHFYQIYLEQ